MTVGPTRSRRWTGALRRLTRRANLAFVGLPAAGTLVALALVPSRGLRAEDLVVLAVMYTLTMAGITVGFHRLLTHKSFRAPAAVRASLAVLGSMAVENPVIIWVADHRAHHAFADGPGDPHSPRADAPGAWPALRAFAHAHVGWLFGPSHRSDPLRYAPDLLRDPAMRRISTAFIPLVLAGIAVAGLLGFALTGTVSGALGGALWGGPVRIFLQQQTTFAVNSFGHLVGERRFVANDRASNVWWLAIPSLGDSWHHNHHVFARSARHGLRRTEVDLSWLAIRAMALVGLARDVVEIEPERQEQRLLVNNRPAPGGPVGS